jgi:tungstate transport system permease protein
MASTFELTFPILTGSLGIAGLTLQVSLSAIAISSLIGVPLGTWLALSHFRGRQVVSTLIYAGMGLPPVVVGLAVYMMLSRTGPLGTLGWLFTPPAMVTAQVLISLPFVIGLTKVAVEAIGPALSEQLRSLGADDRQIGRAVIWEARAGVIVAIIAGFGRIVAEVGAVMLVGGNIEGQTRVLTTAIVLETRRGAFEQAIVLGVMLIGITLFLTAVTLQLARRTRRSVA